VVGREKRMRLILRSGGGVLGGGGGMNLKTGKCSPWKEEGNFWSLPRRRGNLSIEEEGVNRGGGGGIRNSIKKGDQDRKDGDVRVE